MLNKFLLAILAVALSTSAVATPCDNLFDLEDGVIYQVSDGKAYKMMRIGDEYYASNEWVPLERGDYIDDYEQSDKAKVIAEANASLKRIKSGN